MVQVDKNQMRLIRYLQITHRWSSLCPLTASWRMIPNITVRSLLMKT